MHIRDRNLRREGAGFRIAEEKEHGRFKKIRKGQLEGNMFKSGCTAGDSVRHRRGSVFLDIKNLSPS